VVHEGSSTNANFGATVIVDANDIPRPARILGDCVTTYSAEEQKLTVSCLRVNNDGGYLGEHKKAGGYFTLAFTIYTLWERLKF